MLAIIIGLYKLPKIASAEAHGQVHDSIWKYRHLLLGALAIFLYVGAEVSIGSFLTNYFNRPEIGNLTLKDAADMLKYYWGGAMVGRFIGSAVLQRLKPGAVLGFNALVAAVLVLVSMLTLGHTAMWSILLVGLFNSIMFPTIFTLGIAGLGPLTGDGSGLLIAAIIGGAIVPFVQGIIRRQHRHSPCVLPASALLHLYRLLRIHRIEAEGGGSGGVVLSTGGGRISVRRRHSSSRLHLRYPLAMPSAVRLPAGDQELVQIVDAAFADAAQRSGKWLLCRPGCTQCCIGVFEINQLDAMRLRQGMAELKKKIQSERVACRSVRVRR